MLGRCAYLVLQHAFLPKGNFIVCFRIFMENALFIIAIFPGEDVSAIPHLKFQVDRLSGFHCIREEDNKEKDVGRQKGPLLASQGRQHGPLLCKEGLVKAADFSPWRTDLNLSKFSPELEFWRHLKKGALHCKGFCHNKPATV